MPGPIIPKVGDWVYTRDQTGSAPREVYQVTDDGFRLYFVSHDGPRIKSLALLPFWRITSIETNPGRFM